MINSLGEVIMPDSTWTNWQVHIPESLITDSTYVGLIYGFIFEETKSICVVDDPLYFSPERIVGYIGTNAPVWPSAVTENYRRTVFFTGRYTGDRIEGYVISNNSAFGAYPLTTHESTLNTLERFLEKMQARELEEIGHATIIPYSINNTTNDNNKSWNVYVPESILSSPVFCGDLYGKCSNNSIFIYDTLKFPEMKTEKDRIGSIYGNGDDTAVAISCLRNDDNGIIFGEYVDAELRFRLASEREYTRIIIHKREESVSLTDEAVAELKFQLASEIEFAPNDEGVVIISPDADGIAREFKNDKPMIKPDGTVYCPADPMSASSLASGDGFEPVDAIIEPWFVPFWSIDSILVEIQQTDSASISRMYRNLLDLITEFPIFEYIGEIIGVRLMDIESIKESLRVFPEDFVRIVAEWFAEKNQCIINGKITVAQDAADDFVAGLHLLEKLHSAGFIVFEAENAIDEPPKS